MQVKRCQCGALTAEYRRIDAEFRRRNAFAFFPRRSAFRLRQSAANAPRWHSGERGSNTWVHTRESGITSRKIG